MLPPAFTPSNTSSSTGYRHLFGPLTLGLALWLGPLGDASAQTFPALPPTNSVWDDTRAFTPETLDSLATILSTFNQNTGVDFWVTSVTGLDGQVPPRQISRELRRRWSPNSDTPAFLLIYSRGHDASSISVSPAVWDLYPSAHLIAILQRAGELLGQKSNPLEKRLLDGISHITQNIESLDALRLRQTAGQTPLERHASLFFAITLAAVGIVAALLGWCSRKRVTRQASARYFPQAKATTRLGASFGGGVIAKTHPPSP